MAEPKDAPDTDWLEYEEIRGPLVDPVALAGFGLVLCLCLLTMALVLR